MYKYRFTHTSVCACVNGLLNGTINMRCKFHVVDQLINSSKSSKVFYDHTKSHLGRHSVKFSLLDVYDKQK